MTPRQVADLLGHSTSQITELYYVKKDTSRLHGITDSLTCNHYIAGCTKKQAEILQSQNSEKEKKRTRFGPKKAKPGAFWVLEGMRTVENG